MDAKLSLAVLLGAAGRSLPWGDKESIALADQLLAHFGHPTALLAAPPREWNRFATMTRARLEILGAVADLARPAIPVPRPVVHGSREAFGWFRDLKCESQEVLRVVPLNVANEALGVREVFRGTLVDSPARPREILRAVLEANGAGFVVGHNHPSGRAVPSEADARLTARLKWAAEVVGLQFTDHLIVAGDEYFSFADGGLLSQSVSSLKRFSCRRSSRR